ncbi:hypothetical protein NUACC26_096840 [Scytonema sp. NUACC26]
MQEQVEFILQLIQQEPFLDSYNVGSIQSSVIIDTLGIDAPVEKDSHLTYARIRSSDTSAVICVLKPASAGDMTKEETELLETIREKPGIRDRVFKEVTHALVSVARVECDRFVRESPRFYNEGIFSIYQFRQTLLQTSQTYNCESMVKVRHLLNVLRQKIATYNSAVTTINECIQSVQLYDCLLPSIEQLQSEKVNPLFSENGLWESNGAFKSRKL